MSIASPTMPMGMRERSETAISVATSGWRKKSRYWAAKRRMEEGGGSGFRGTCRPDSRPIVDYFTRGIVDFPTEPRNRAPRHVRQDPRRHPLRLRPRPRRPHDVGGPHLLSGIPRPHLPPAGARVLDARVQVARPPDLALLALPHRHRDP